MVASNDPITLDEGDGQTVTMLSEFHSSAIEEEAAVMLEPEVNTSRAQREAGDQVNRYLFCAIVSQSAKLIKASAANAGETLPMTMIVRGVLRSYRQEAKNRYGALSEPELDFAGLRSLNEKVLRDEIARHSHDRVNNSERQLAHAKRSGDDTNIKANKDGLEHAIELRDRLARKFR